MDLNFATGLHNLVNAVLFLLVQIPDMTYLRCLRYCGEGQLKCEPRPGALLRLPGGGPDVAGHACRQLAGHDLRGGAGVPGVGHALVRPAESGATPRSPPRSSAGGGPVWWEVGDAPAKIHGLKPQAAVHKLIFIECFEASLEAGISASDVTLHTASLMTAASPLTKKLCQREAKLCPSSAKGQGLLTKPQATLQCPSN